MLDKSADKNSSRELSILLVDSDGAFRKRLTRALCTRGYAVTTSPTAAKAIEVAERISFEWAIVDLRLPDCSGLDLTVALKEKMRYVRILVLTRYGTITSAVEAMRLGAYSYLTKPTTTNNIVEALTAAGPRSTSAEISLVKLARVEWEHIQRVLADCGGNKSEAARRLGITMATLQSKLRISPAGDEVNLIGKDSPEGRFSRASILLVDPDDVNRGRLVQTFRHLAYAVSAVDGATNAFELAAHKSFEWAIVGLRLPNRSGLDFTALLKQRMPKIRILILAAR